MESVKKWFDSGCNYSIGIEIYSQLNSCNKNILRILKLKETKPNLDKLKYELGKFLPKESNSIQNQKQEQTSVKISTTAEENEKAQRILFHNLPAELRPELFKANELFRKNCFLKVTLNELSADQEEKALEIQIEIAENFKLNKLCWSKIDHWIEHRQLPSLIENEFSKLSPAQLLRKQQYLFQNISKMQKRFLENSKQLTSCTDTAKKSKLQRLIAKQDSDLIKKNEELQTITRLINGK
jgi:hypothetical protein